MCTKPILEQPIAHSLDRYMVVMCTTDVSMSSRGS